MKRHLFSLTALLVMVVLAFGSVDTTNTTTTTPTLPPPDSTAEPVVTGIDHSTPSQTSPPVPMIFDVSTLVGKSIDEIRTVLGKPEDDQLEPSERQRLDWGSEWSNEFIKDKQELLVTFDAKTRQVVDLFLVGDNQTTLMQRANLRSDDPTYRIEPVPVIGDSSKITGIKILANPTEPGGMHPAIEGASEAGGTHRLHLDSKAERPQRWEREARVFTSDAGTELKAILVSVMVGTDGIRQAVLQKEDGTTVRVPENRLSDADRNFIESWVKGRK